MNRIKLENIRLNFPSVFQRSVFSGKVGKFEVTILIDKSDKKTVNLVQSALKSFVDDNKIDLPSDDMCLKDGGDTKYDGNKSFWLLKASSNHPPTVVDSDKSKLSEDDGKIYAGCYANVIIDFWLMDNSFGKKVNANLYGVQFVKHGSNIVDVTEEFDDLENCDLEDIDVDL